MSIKKGPLHAAIAEIGSTLPELREKSRTCRVCKSLIRLYGMRQMNPKDASIGAELVRTYEGYKEGLSYYQIF